MATVIDLDILRPERRIVTIAQKEIDVSFIPCGITFDIDRITFELQKIPEKKIKDGGEECRKAFDLTIELCAAFTSHLYPEMDKTWFSRNADAVQINAFANAIKEALVASYKGVADYGKK